MGSGKPKDDTIKEEKKEDKPKEEKKKEKKVEKKKEEPRKIISKMIEGVRGIVRFAEADLQGSKKVRNALLDVRGISHGLVNAIIVSSGIDGNKMIGALTEEEIKKLEDVAKNPGKYGIPSFILNRRKDMATGEDMHKLSSELVFMKKSDIDHMKKMQCYKGVRHQLGLPVRGQRTRSSFRTGEKVGVIKKKEEPKKAPEPAAK
jgi:small subunit ribosomal protein S13